MCRGFGKWALLLLEHKKTIIVIRNNKLQKVFLNFCAFVPGIWGAQPWQWLYLRETLLFTLLTLNSPIYLHIPISSGSWKVWDRDWWICSQVRGRSFPKLGCPFMIPLLWARLLLWWLQSSSVVISWALSYQRSAWSLHPGCAVTLLYLTFSCLLAGAKGRIGTLPKGRIGTLPVNHAALSATEEESQVLHKSLDSFSFHFHIIWNVLSRD